MSNRLLAAFAVGLAVLAFLFLIASARSQELCAPIPLALVQANITEHKGGKLAPLSQEGLDFARGLYVASPPISHYPAGERALIATMPMKMSVVIFMRGDEACGSLLVQTLPTALLLDLDKGI